MKRLIASAIALSVVAAPAVAATSTAPAKASKQVKKSNVTNVNLKKADSPKKK